MSLFLEPGKLVPFEVEGADGVTWYAKVLTAREQLTLLEHAERLDKADDMLAAALREDVWAVLKLGLTDWVEGTSADTQAPLEMPIADERLDTIPIRYWGSLTSKIVEVNQLGGDDQGNSLASSDPSSATSQPHA